MNKIFNWTIGSFFRTIGRIIAIGLISILFYSILSKSGFKISDLISIEKVYAAESLSWTTQQSRIYYDQQGTENQTSWQTIPYTQSLSYPATQMQFRLQYSGGFKAGNTYKFKISYLPSPDSLNASGIWFSDGTNTLTQVNCSGWARESNNYYANICAVSPEVDISSSGYLYVRVVFNESYVNSVRSWVGNFDETKGTGAIIQDSAIDIINNQNDNTQEIINKLEEVNSIPCKNLLNITLTNGNNNGITWVVNEDKTITLNGIATATTFIRIANDLTIQFGTYTLSNGNDNASVNTALFYDDNGYFTRKNISIYTALSDRVIKPYIRVENGTTLNNFVIKPMIEKGSEVTKYCKYGTHINGSESTTDAINDLNNSINDDNINNNEYSDVLDIDAGDDLSFGPFSGFLMLPLTWIQTFLVPQTACQNINIPLPFLENKYLTLPCMDEFWQNMGVLGDLISLVWIAVVGVRIFNGLFVLVVDTTSSAPNAEQLYKVKSWEL